MPNGSEFQTVGAATLKPQDAKIVQTHGTDNRLAFAEHRDVRGMVIQKGMQVSRMSVAESVVDQCGKFKFYALLNRKPMKIFKYTKCVYVLWESMTETMCFSCQLLNMYQAASPNFAYSNV